MSPFSSVARRLTQACVGLTTTILFVATSHSVTLAQNRRIEIKNDDDIQALFDVVYRPQRDPAPFQLQNSVEREAYALIRTILASGTVIYVRTSQDGNYGSYNASQDVLTLRPSALDHWGIFLETMRHEGWHVVQACVAGQNNIETLIPAGLQVSRRTIQNLRQNHNYAPDEIPIEAEAFEAELHPNLTLEALKKECADWMEENIPNPKN